MGALLQHDQLPEGIDFAAAAAAKPCASEVRPMPVSQDETSEVASAVSSRRTFKSGQSAEVRPPSRAQDVHKPSQGRPLVTPCDMSGEVSAASTPTVASRNRYIAL